MVRVWVGPRKRDGPRGWGPGMDLVRKGSVRTPDEETEEI